MAWAADGRMSGRPLRRGKPYLYLLPILIGYLSFTLAPVIIGFVYSLSTYHIGSELHPVGLQNCQDLRHSDLFWTVLSNTAYYAVLYVPMNIAVALGLALLLEKKVRGISFFRTIYFLPVVTSMVAAAMIWGWLYNADLGLLNYVLSIFGVQGPRWLEDPKWAMPALAIMAVWKNAGYNMMIFLAGLTSIGPEYYEAARLEGATPMQRFRTITLPLLSPVIFFVSVVTCIGAFQVFEQTYVLTRGGPGVSTLTLSFHIWQTAFQFFNIGGASAMAFVLFGLLLLLTAVQFMLRKRWVFQQ